MNERTQQSWGRTGCWGDRGCSDDPAVTWATQEEGGGAPHQVPSGCGQRTGRGVESERGLPGRALQQGDGPGGGTCLRSSAPPAFRSGLDCLLVAGGCDLEASIVVHQKAGCASNPWRPGSELATPLLGLRITMLLSSRLKPPASHPPV